MNITLGQVRDAFNQVFETMRNEKSERTLYHSPFEFANHLQNTFRSAFNNRFKLYREDDIVGEPTIDTYNNDYELSNEEILNLIKTSVTDFYTPRNQNQQQDVFVNLINQGLAEQLKLDHPLTRYSSDDFNEAEWLARSFWVLCNSNVNSGHFTLENLRSFFNDHERAYDLLRDISESEKHHRDDVFKLLVDRWPHEHAVYHSAALFTPEATKLIKSERQMREAINTLVKKNPAMFVRLYETERRPENIDMWLSDEAKELLMTARKIRAEKSYATSDESSQLKESLFGEKTRDDGNNRRGGPTL